MKPDPHVAMLQGNDAQAMLLAVCHAFLDYIGLVLVANHAMHDTVFLHSFNLSSAFVSRKWTTIYETFHILRPTEVRITDQGVECVVELGRPIAAEDFVVLLNYIVYLGQPSARWVFPILCDRLF